MQWRGGSLDVLYLPLLQVAFIDKVCTGYRLLMDARSRADPFSFPITRSTAGNSPGLSAFAMDPTSMSGMACLPDRYDRSSHCCGPSIATFRAPCNWLVLCTVLDYPCSLVLTAWMDTYGSWV